MIIEINYTALHWDNHQGGSGTPISERLLREVPDDMTLSEMRVFASSELGVKSQNTRNLIGDYILTNIVIDA